MNAIRLLKPLENSLEKQGIFKPPYGACFICKSMTHWGNSCNQVKKKNPEQDLLSEAISSISEYNSTSEYDHNLKLLV